MKGSMRNIGENAKPILTRPVTRQLTIQNAKPKYFGSPRKIQAKIQHDLVKIPKEKYNKIMQNIMQELKIKQNEENKCLVCCDNLSNVVFYPCYHGNICKRCAVAHLKTQTKCLLCRAVDFLQSESRKVVPCGVC